MTPKSLSARTRENRKLRKTAEKSANTKTNNGNLTPSEMGKLGGAARMNGLTPEQRKELAKKAAAARWEKKPDEA